VEAVVIAPAGMWTLEEAVDLCAQIERVCPDFGCHVALTGGVLYKDGPRKDVDILFYRVRQVDEIDVEGLFEALRRERAIETTTPLGRFVVKATHFGRSIDFFFPEVASGDYTKAPQVPEVEAVGEVVF
jgi:hypothetical protein